MTKEKFKGKTDEEFKTLYNEGFSATNIYVQDLQNQLIKAKEKLNTSSKNSSKPSSKDNNKRPNSRKKSGKPSGGQPGHKGSTLRLNDNPDTTILIEPTDCHCGHLFTGEEIIVSEERRQEIDIPKPITITKEYKSIKYICPVCGEIHSGEFPNHIKAPIQYGTNLKAYLVYLNNFQLLPYKRTVDLLANLHNLQISEGTIDNILEEFSGKIDTPIELIKKAIIDSEKAHADESGLRSEGKRKWLHVIGNENYTYYFFHKSRGKNAVDEADVLPHFKGTLCHDFWTTYFQFDKCEHSLCNAHHLRELQGIIDNYGYSWAKKMKSFLEKTNKLVKNAKENEREKLSDTILAKLDKEYDEIIKNAFIETPPPPPRKKGQRGRIPKGKALCLLERLNNYKDAIVDFITDFKKPFDNNLAERDVRMIKVKEKISGTFRSDKGAQRFCKIRSLISTAIKQNQNVFETIKNIFLGESFLENLN